MKTPQFIPLTQSEVVPNEQLIERAAQFQEKIRKRHFSPRPVLRPVPRQVIESVLRAAGTATSGANLQPWYFVVVSQPAVKREIRLAAETEEKEFYEHRAPAAWLDALAPLGTDWRKPFLETAPWLIAIFSQPYRMLPDGTKLKHYYATES